MEFIVESMLFMRGDDEVTNVRATARRVEGMDAVEAITNLAAVSGGHITQIIRPAEGRATAIMQKGEELYRLVAVPAPHQEN